MQAFLIIIGLIAIYIAGIAAVCGLAWVFVQACTGRMRRSGEFDHCKVRACVFHACMSDGCQFNHIKINAPHVVLEYGQKLERICPNAKIIRYAMKEIKRTPGRG